MSILPKKINFVLIVILFTISCEFNQKEPDCKIIEYTSSSKSNNAEWKSTTRTCEGVNISYESPEKEIQDSLKKNGLKYFGIVHVENEISDNPSNIDLVNWLRFTVVYTYRQPKGTTFNIDSIELSEFTNYSSCMGWPGKFTFILNEKMEALNDSCYFSNHPEYYEAMAPRKIENFKFTNIKNSPFARIIPVCFFDAKKKEKYITEGNIDDDYRAVGCTLFFNYNCKNFDFQKLLDDPEFKQMILFKDTSKILLSTNYKMNQDEK